MKKILSIVFLIICLVLIGIGIEQTGTFCLHDWEKIVSDKYYKVTYYDDLKDRDVKGYIPTELASGIILSADSVHYMGGQGWWIGTEKYLYNKVCLKCGKCYNADKVAEKWIKNQLPIIKRNKIIYRERQKNREGTAKKCFEEGNGLKYPKAVQRETEIPTEWAESEINATVSFGSFIDEPVDIVNFETGESSVIKIPKNRIYKTGDTVQNLHSGQTSKLKEIETTRVGTDYHAVFILKGDSRWDAENFHKNWKVIKEK